MTNAERDLQLIGETPNPDDEETGRKSNLTNRSSKNVHPFTPTPELI